MPEGFPGMLKALGSIPSMEKQKVHFVVVQSLFFFKGKVFHPRLAELCLDRQSTKITDVCHYTWLRSTIYMPDTAVYPSYKSRKI